MSGQIFVCLVYIHSNTVFVCYINTVIRVFKYRKNKIFIREHHIIHKITCVIHKEQSINHSITLNNTMVYR